MAAPPLRVLLVDDSQLFLDLLTAFVERHWGGAWEVAGTATTGEQGLQLAAALRPDAVTVDLRMPGLSGLEVIARLRPLLPDLAIVALTQHCEEPVRAAMLAAGADAFISKADLAADLLPALAHSLARHGPPRRSHSTSRVP